MTLSTPRHPVWLWLAGVVLWFTIIPLIGYDGRLYYAEGGQSIDGPAMLLAAAVPTSVMLLPGLLLLQGCYLLGYCGAAPLWNFRAPSLAGTLLSIVAMLASLFFLWCLFWRVEFWKPTRAPFVVYLLAWAIYFQYLRAAAANRARPRDDTADVFT